MGLALAVRVDASGALDFSKQETEHTKQHSFACCKISKGRNDGGRPLQLEVAAARQVFHKPTEPGMGKRFVHFYVRRAGELRGHLSKFRQSRSREAVSFVSGR